MLWFADPSAERNSCAALGLGGALFAVICGDGSYYKYRIDPSSGACTRDAYYKFLTLAED